MFGVRAAVSPVTHSLVSDGWSPTQHEESSCADEPSAEAATFNGRLSVGCPTFPVAISRRPYPIPSRTRKSSFSEPMVLHGQPCGRVGRCRVNLQKASRHLEAFCFFVHAQRPRGNSGPFAFCSPAKALEEPRGLLGAGRPGPSACARPQPNVQLISTVWAWSFVVDDMVVTGVWALRNTISYARRTTS